MSKSLPSQKGFIHLIPLLVIISVVGLVANYLLTSHPLKELNKDSKVAQVDAQAAPVTLTTQVNSSTDDVNEVTNKFDATATTVWIGTNGSATVSYAGLRFNNLTIPQGATITAAHIDVYSTASQWINVGLNIGAQAADNAPTFSSSSRPSQRTLTTQRTTYSFDTNWAANTWYSLNEMVPVVQEVINRPGWNPGNSMVFVLKGTVGTYGKKLIRSFNGGATQAPKLVVTYTTSGPSPTATPTPIPTPTPSPTPTVVPVGNNSLQLDGSDDQMNGALYPNSTGTQTIEAWVRPTSFRSDGSGEIVLHDRFDDDTHGWILELRNDVVAGHAKAEFWVDDGTGTNDQVIDNTLVPITLNNWYHLAATYDQTNNMVILYINGQGVNRTMPAFSTGFKTRVGTFGGGADPIYHSMTGQIDEARISSNIRYNGTFTPPIGYFTPDVNTLALYHFDEGSGQTTGDTSGNNIDLSLGTTGSTESTDPVWISTGAPIGGPGPTSTPTPTPTRTPTPTSIPTPTPTPTLAPLSVGSANFRVASAWNDNLTRQIIRTVSDKVYLLGGLNEGSTELKVYWTDNTGYPSSISDFNTIGATTSDPAAIISADGVYDGGGFIHILTNTQAGQLIDHPFDITSNTFKSAITLATGNPTRTCNSTPCYLGTQGVSGMFDKLGNLHLSYWGPSNQILYRSYTYDTGTNALNLTSGPTRLDTSGAASHPEVVVSPVDNSVTVAWTNGFSGSGTIKAKTRSVSGSWGVEESVSTGAVWTDSNFGYNIDQGPSMVISSDGSRHLSYIETFGSCGADYGRMHYVTRASTGTTWTDNTLNNFCSHAPGLAIDNSDNIYALGHGHPSNPTCTQMTQICSVRKNGASWDNPVVFASPSGSDSFDASISTKWSVVGWNRPETIEFLFFSANSGSYLNTSLYYSRIATSGFVAGGPTPTPSPTTIPTLTPTPTPVPCTIISAAWNASSNPILETSPVSLVVNTTGVCTGLSLSYEIREDDAPLGFDPVIVTPSNILISDTGVTAVNWTAEYQQDGLLGINDPPEYYFIATIVGTGTNMTSSNPELQVTQLGGGNQPPVISSVTSNPTSGLAPLSVNFTGIATDPENDPLTFSWNFGDGANGTGANISHVYSTAGLYSAQVTVSDATHQVVSNPITITVNNAQPVTVTYQVGVGTNDVNEVNATLDATSTTAWLGSGGSSTTSFTGLRFTGINIPQNSIIQSAKLEVNSAQAQWQTIGFIIAADASGNSLAFSTSSKPSQRALTAAKVTHSSNVNWLANTWYQLNEMAPVIQEIVNRSDWSSGNSLSVITNGTGGAFGRKFIKSFEGAPASAPRLIITYR